MVSIELRCSVDQLMNTGLFHAGEFDSVLFTAAAAAAVEPFFFWSEEPHRGNLLKTLAMGNCL